MGRVRADHHRMHGNGWCTRPAQLDCSFDTICESCGFLATTSEFKPPSPAKPNTPPTTTGPAEPSSTPASPHAPAQAAR